MYMYWGALSEYLHGSSDAIVRLSIELIILFDAHG